MELDTCISCLELLIDAAITKHLYKCLSIVLSCADVVYPKIQFEVPVAPDPNPRQDSKYILYD